MTYINNSVILALVGSFVALVGWQLRFRAIKGQYRTRGGRMKVLYHFGRITNVFGVLMLALGLSAGFMGPIKVGNWQLPLFQGEYFDRMREEAIPYAQKHIKMSGKPKRGWRGKPNRVIEYRVENTGNRKVRRIWIRIRRQPGTGTGELTRKIDGPFLPHKVKKVFPKFPENAAKSYFYAPTTHADIRIIGAAF